MANRIEIIIESVSKGLEKGLHNSQSGFQKFSKAALGAGVALSAGLAVGLEKSVRAALDEQKVEARLAQAFKNSGLSAARYEGRVHRLEDASRKLGFQNHEIDDSLGSLITATGSAKDSISQLSIAENLARFKGVDLAQATKALTMAHAGSLRALKQLGLDIPKVTDAQDALKASTKNHTGAAYASALAVAKLQDKQSTYKNVLAKVTSATKGQADAFSKTAAGSMEQFKAQLNALEVTLGKALLPAITAVSAKLAEFLSYLTKHKTLTKALVIALGALAAALLASAVAQAILNAAVLANPYVAATVAIIALAAGVIYLQKKYQAVTKTIDFLKQHMYLLLAVPMVGTTLFIAGEMIKHWGAIKSAVTTSINAIITAAHALMDAYRAVRGVFNDALGAAKAVWNFLKRKVPVPDFSGVLGAINAVIGAARTAFSWLQKLEFWKGPGASKQGAPTSGSTGNRGTRHGRALGGSVRALQSYMVGERGPEILTMGNRGGTITPNGGGAMSVTVPVYLDSRKIAEATFDVNRSLARQYQRTSGRPAFS